jgi:hypothetical protein
MIASHAREELNKTAMSNQKLNDRSNQKLNEVKLFLRQWPTFLSHVETVEHLEGGSQLMLKSEGLYRHRLLNMSGGNELQVWAHINGGKAYTRGDSVDRVSQHPRGLETGTGRGSSFVFGFTI